MYFYLLYPQALSKEYLDRFDADKDGIIERSAGEFKDTASQPLFDKDMDGRVDDGKSSLCYTQNQTLVSQLSDCLSS